MRSYYTPYPYRRLPNCYDENGEPMNHKENVTEVFEHGIDLYTQETIDNLFLAAKSIYQMVDELKGHLDKDVAKKIQESAVDIGKKIAPLTSDDISYYYYRWDSNTDC